MLRQNKPSRIGQRSCSILFSCLVLGLLASPLGSVQSACAQDEPLAQKELSPQFDSTQPVVTADDLRTEKQTASTVVAPLPTPSTLPAMPKDPLLFEKGSTRIKISLDGVMQESGVTGSWWNLSGEFAPDEAYKLDRAWTEIWIKPGLRLDTSLTDWLKLYSGVSYVGSGNISKDVFEQGNRGVIGG
jgi:hypothetical protein